MSVLRWVFLLMVGVGDGIHFYCWWCRGVAPVCGSRRRSPWSYSFPDISLSLEKTFNAQSIKGVTLKFLRDCFLKKLFLEEIGRRKVTPTPLSSNVVLYGITWLIVFCTNWHIVLMYIWMVYSSILTFTTFFTC